ncbi:MAG: alpha/beta hydrolase [Betaproteobacteria bacterium]
MRVFKMVWVVLALMLCSGAWAGQYVQLGSDLELYYEEAGSGKPLVFITGWTGTNEFFTRYQLPHFAKTYRALAYDPRSQGRSSKTLENNNYTQHGRDLRDFIDTLKLKEPVLIAWSSGCHDVYAYFRAYGPDNVRAFVCIDQTPRSTGLQPGDWAEFPDYAAAGGFVNGVAYSRRAMTLGFIPTMTQRKMPQAELDWVLDQSLKTPTYAATLLAADDSFSDYRAEARAIDGKLPVLNILSEANAKAGKAWLASNAPASEVFVLGNHMMFWEYPEQFNSAVDKFLQKHQ